MKDHLRGCIYQASQKQIQEIIDRKLHLCRKEDQIKKFFSKFKKVNDIEGYWTHYVKIGGEKYWEFDKVKPYKLF